MASTFLSILNHPFGEILPSRAKMANVIHLVTILRPDGFLSGSRVLGPRCGISVSVQEDAWRPINKAQGVPKVTFGGRIDKAGPARPSKKGTRKVKGSDQVVGRINFDRYPAHSR